MSTQEIVERILSDAQAEAERIVAAAQSKADGILAEASARAQAERRETEAEAAAFDKDIKDKRAAAARLESAKILLREKRKVLDYIYAEALSRLKALSKEDCLALYERLLEAYAEENDAVVLSENFAYEQELKAFPVIGERSLIIAKDRAPIAGGMLLKGEKSDKDLSFEALIEADKEAYLAQIAAEIF